MGWQHNHRGTGSYSGRFNSRGYIGFFTVSTSSILSQSTPYMMPTMKYCIRRNPRSIDPSLMLSRRTFAGGRTAHWASPPGGGASRPSFATELARSMTLSENSKWNPGTFIC
ncbi:hypothetical protein PCH_Pc12g14340 [Penicillium rubens Wisconsin 54-1255]|uniref:Uncharacterized protein n=1 Tax=Penicillium rubens (strain ATCC 28089 / DSM 1075 / NRRL 1951 / Wisconsin 54-1255) TaxID=500485 RepID=B6H0U3_PENRW|nr:hypothetical protein PCH_Pc12g14340 [Penicillium rubens Wisconsin 54-1255]